MGLIKAAAGATGGVLADQWKEYFYCEALDADTLVAKGEKRTSARSSNKKGEENIISNGSVIAVNDGQCMIIVEQGKVVELCAEPGEFVYDTSTEPSIFCGKLGESLKKTFATIGKRFTFGGDTAKDQRVYYFNTKDVDIAIRCHGEYSYHITDPMLFYTNVCGNVADSYTRDEIDSQLKTELMTALQPAFAKISDMGIRYSALPGHTMEIADALNEVLSPKWHELRGVEIVSFGVSSVNASPEDENMIKELQKNAVFTNPGMAAAHLVGAQAQAMQDAAKNEGGAMNAFFGMNMAQNASGQTIQNLFSKAAENNQNAGAASANEWVCSCGKKNTGKFCAECGKPKPESSEWICSCGAHNTGKFCSECGKSKPVTACPKCGYKPDSSKPVPKFCPECGAKFE